MKRWISFAPVVALALAGCEGAPVPSGGEASVQVRFSAAGASRTLKPAAGAASTQEDGEALRIEGSNGVLTLKDVRLILDELRLSPGDEDCPLPGGVGDEDLSCRFASGPFFLDLPLGGEAARVIEDYMPAGAYGDVGFRVGETEEGGPEDDRGDGFLAREVRSVFPEWPDHASLMLEGAFAPVRGTPRTFRVFIEADSRIVMKLDPPLVVAGEGPPGVVTVETRPDRWLKRLDGSILELSLYDFGRTGAVLEFDLELGRGFGDAASGD